MNTDEEGLPSCWGRLKLKLGWTKRRVMPSAAAATSKSNRGVDCSCDITDITVVFKLKQPKPIGGFRYDPLSYAQNFDDFCCDHEDVDSAERRFSSRYAAPLPRSVGNK